MKILYVISEDDGAAITFEQEYGGRPVTEIIKAVEAGESIIDKYEEHGIDLKIIEVGEVSKKFRKFLRRQYIDYDHSKNAAFYFEDEKVDVYE